ncbi:MAG: type II CRISPR RNA-guided endonuclease Cas9 [Bacteroidales bacterium]|nr:type II CRISPR RNA-guided endonuclease Cas9 [Bacteroidales bacterium]
MKKILGLDLGSASIGWALIAENDFEGNVKREILGLGSRIIPYEGTEGKDFEKGTGESRNSIRTKARTTRKGYDRYQLRRELLVEELVKSNMMPDEILKKLSKKQLWELRSKAVSSRVSLQELGRILLWLNQKRGYKSSRKDANLDKKDTEYVANVKSRHEKIKELKLTIGQYFCQEIQKDDFYRVKENIFPRDAYLEEFDAICKQQQLYYPDVLSEKFIEKIRNEIIYYQRPLKSQKGLVSICEFEGKWIKGKDGKEYFVGPRVVPKSSPLFQLCKIWENVNNIKIGNKTGGNIEISMEDKVALFEHLDNNEKLTQTDVVRILNLKKNECFFNKQIANGIKGNITKHAILSCFNNPSQYRHLLEMRLKIVETNKECYLYDKKTGEVLSSKLSKYVDSSVEQEPLYQLWHTIYSISDQEECSKVLQSNFKIEKEAADKLAAIDFSKHGFGDKSAKVIRKILPYLMDGDVYSQAMCYAGFDHSNSLTKDQNLQRKLYDNLKPITKNSLRQPIVEKILNQMVNVVNALINKYGKPDEIRVELARELKQSKEERNDIDKKMRKRQRENEQIAKKLEEMGLRATRNNIIKWRLYEEMDNEDKKLNAICIYCGQPISLTEAIKGSDVDIEHIIPKSKLFDDSQSNKTLAHRHCNANKNDQTAFDFMKGKSEQVFNAYIERVNMLYANKVISRTKRNKLLMSENEIPDDFIDRQLRESQYIAKKAREILQIICYNVWSTSGSVTAELRHLWGWDDITMNLQFDKYKELGLTQTVEWDSDHGKNSHKKEVIVDWTKRDDHRHHAVDALVIACTKQGYIQRFNTLNSGKTKEDLKADIEERSIEFKEKHSLLEKYIISEQPFPVKEVEEKVANILISFKAGKRVAVLGKRKVGKRGNKKVVQTGIIVPRGALSEESVYGKIKTPERKPIKYAFENSHLIVLSKIKRLVEERIVENEDDIKKAIASLKKKPLYIDGEKQIPLEYASCFDSNYVIKYKVDVNFNKVDKVVDKGIKNILQTRLDKFGGSFKEAFKDVQHGDKFLKWYEDEGLERAINSVRCFTGLSAVVPVKKDGQGRNIGFVKPGNNQHVAIYIDAEGNSHEHVCTFWHAVERKKYGIPVVIQNTNEVWDKIQEKPEGYYPESFLEKLPEANWKMQLSMQQNEMLVLGMNNEEFTDAVNSDNKSLLSKYLYVVWSVSESDYWFRHHLETKNAEIKNIVGARESKRYYRIKSIKAFYLLNPHKVKIDCIGNISL